MSLGEHANDVRIAIAPFLFPALKLVFDALRKQHSHDVKRTHMIQAIAVDGIFTRQSGLRAWIGTEKGAFRE